ncbi:MAG: aldolase [Zoogloea sp.]|nr:aldolase [Zoogloea sp.]
MTNSTVSPSPWAINPAYQLPAPGGLQIGTFVKTPAPHVIEVLATGGMDFAVLDAEHAPMDRAALDLALLAGRAVQLPLFVRVLDRSADAILSALDLGAIGLLVPHIDTVEDATAVVAHARYRGGDRGFSGSARFGGYGTFGMKEALRLGDQALVMCQIESVQAVQACEAIAAVPGVAGVFIGRADLALSMGLDTMQDPRIEEAVDHIVRVGLAAGKTIGMAVNSTSERDRYATLGATWFVQGSDQSLLRQAAQAIARPR